MHSEITKLRQIHEELISGKTATPTTIRDFLSCFDVKRRTYWNVIYVNEQLAKCDLQTVPNYLNIWVDTPITFELISEKGKRVEQESSVNVMPEEVALESFLPDQSFDIKVFADPAFRVGKLKASTQGIVSVKPNEPIAKAMTIMMSRNLSQLPVMTTEREVKGVVSWASIGERFAVGADKTCCQHFMNDYHEINISANLFAAIKIIAEHNYVLVKDAARRYTGIITANDIALQFEEISTPFLLLSEIENHLRLLISGSLSIESIKSTCEEQYLPKDFLKISDLTFGNHVHIFKHPENWEKIGLHLDKDTFVEDLTEANRIRNEVMHFDLDSIEPDDLSKLRDMSRLLDTLRRIARIFE